MGVTSDSVVRYEPMIGDYLGETAGRLKRVFD